jgi:hypothetical protein
MAFYWVRWLPQSGQDVPIFLPGFKTDQLVDVPIAAVPSVGGQLWRAPLISDLLISGRRPRLG